MSDESTERVAGRPDGWCFDCAKPVTDDCVYGDHSYRLAIAEDEYEAMKSAPAKPFSEIKRELEPAAPVHAVEAQEERERLEDEIFQDATDPAWEEDDENVTCPFCQDGGYDLVGLASHLIHDCEPFNNIERPQRL